MPSRDALTLEIPADAQYLTTARLFAGAVGRQLGMSEDRVGDLKLAASDTCTWLMRWASAEGSHRHILIRIVPDGRRLLVDVASDGHPVSANPDSQIAAGEDEMRLGLAVIRAITDDLEVRDVDEATTITFSFPLEADG